MIGIGNQPGESFDPVVIDEIHCKQAASYLPDLHRGPICFLKHPQRTNIEVSVPDRQSIGIAGTGSALAEQVREVIDSVDWIRNSPKDIPDCEK